MADSFEVTTSPIAALMNSTLLVGVERDEAGDLKLYLGARWKGVYALLPAGADADAIERQWNGYGGHMFVRPIPPSDALFCDRPA